MTSFSVQAGEALPSGWRLISLQETDSTNEELLRRRATDPGEGVAVMAAVQSAGRGRRGRAWQSPTGNLYLSVRLAQAATLAETAQLSFVTAVAMADAIERLCPKAPVKLKWPNDLLIEGAKVSGILLEADPPWVVAGIGVNLVTAPPVGTTPYPATSLEAASGLRLPPEVLAPVFLGVLSATVAVWRTGGFPAIRERWLARAHGLGEKISVALQGESRVEGVFADLDDNGALLLARPDGLRRIMAGDVYFQRQTP